MAKKYVLQAVLVKKSVAPTREAAWNIARNFMRRIYEYSPGAKYHHFTRIPARNLRMVRTYTPRKFKQIKFKYGLGKD